MTDFVIQVSAHGKIPALRPNFDVPEGFQIAFFCKLDDIILWDKSVKIYNALAASDTATVNSMVVNRIYPTGTTVDFALWELGDPSYITGTLLMGSKQAIVDITGVKESNPISLSNLLAQTIVDLKADKPGNTFTIYFNACRE
jgi:hypothetical protein